MKEHLEESLVEQIDQEKKFSAASLEILLMGFGRQILEHEDAVADLGEGEFPSDATQEFGQFSIRLTTSLDDFVSKGVDEALERVAASGVCIEGCFSDCDVIQQVQGAEHLS